MLKGRNFLEPGDFSPYELDEIFTLAEQIMNKPASYAHVCDGRLLSTLF